jgi:cell division septum initiation protein DivIVA
MESSEESVTPRFATVVRGYDRLQVDDYIDHLNQWIEQADNRAQQSEAAAAEATLEVDELRRRGASLEAEALTSTPESMKALGNRVGTIMQSAFTAAKELHDRAGEDARSTVDAAEERAAQVVAEATAQAEELSRAAEDIFVQAREVLAGANNAVAQEVEQAKARGEAEAADIIERARAEATELAHRSAVHEEAARERLAQLEERRLTVLQEVGLLHERLGTISEGLSAPVRAGKPDRPDDETQIIELNSAPRSAQRGAASSAR